MRVIEKEWRDALGDHRWFPTTFRPSHPGPNPGYLGFRIADARLTSGGLPARLFTRAECEAEVARLRAEDPRAAEAAANQAAAIAYVNG